MNHEEFRKALEMLGMTPPRFASLIGYDERKIRRYALGETKVPRIVELLLNFALYVPDAFAELVKVRELLDDEL